MLSMIMGIRYEKVEQKIALIHFTMIFRRKVLENGAGEGFRTLDLNLGKVALYP